MRCSSFLFHKSTVKLAVACLLTLVLTLYWSWNQCEVATPPQQKHPNVLRNQLPSLADCKELISKVSKTSDTLQPGKNCPRKIPFQKLDIVVNGERTIEGRLDSENDEAFVPFSFVKEYFEIYGDIQIDENDKKFLDWKHSYSEVKQLEGKYNYKGPFLWFKNYHVEGRSRVKCISGIEGVPVSTQWDPKGYFYPIQIAQFGLEHYSKLQLEGPSKPRVFEDAEKPSEMNWVFSDSSAQVKNVFAKDRNTRVIQFYTEDLNSQGVSLHLDSSLKNLVISFDLKLEDEVQVTVMVETDHTQLHVLHYSTNEDLISRRGGEINYGIGTWKGWRHVNRNLDTDLRKGLGFSNTKETKKLNKKLTITEVQSINFRGKGFIDNIALSHSAHAESFIDAADWMIRNQNEMGGWSIDVRRKIEGAVMESGWHSAMAQGHAMSLLTRAYRHTKKPIYLEAALKATEVFKIKSEDRGVLATFIDKYNWYEEYPTTPPLFVLNGFIYSLFGLYDLKSSAPLSKRSIAEKLFDEGIRALHALLPLFDTGSGTFYDLRHVSMGVAPNRARWDYHTLHVSQLMTLYEMTEDTLFKNTADRWASYTKGKRAKHN